MCLRFVSSVSLRCNNNQTRPMRMLTRITIQLSGHRGSGLVNFEHLDEIFVEPKNEHISCVELIIVYGILPKIEQWFVVWFDLTIVMRRDGNSEDDDCDCDSFMQGARNALTHKHTHTYIHNNIQLKCYCSQWTIKLSGWDGLIWIWISI